MQIERKAFLKFNTTFLMLCILLDPSIYGQSKHIENTFRYPLDGKIELSGNYAEIRPNHFHAGLDLRTDNTKNLPIHSIEDGYVSRIKVSTYGYGKVLYITHPNGYVSVYAHQHHYNEAIGNYVKTAQQINESFEIELFPKQNELPVKKGDIIGYTGNTGNSNGPHLHFEIREEKSEVPMNPLRFYDIADNIAPEIKGIYFYNLNNMEDPLLFKDLGPLLKSIKENTIKDIVDVPSCFGIGISAFDTESPGGNTNQVYSVEIVMDDAPFYKHIFDSIAFDKARYVNCFTDLNTPAKSKKIQKCFISKNEELPVFKLAINNGEVVLKDNEIHTLKFIISDIKGNKKEVLVKIQNKKTIILDNNEDKASAKYDCMKQLLFEDMDCKLNIPEKTFYNDYTITWISNDKATAIFSKQLILKGITPPLFKSFEIYLKPINVRNELISKLCLVDLNTHNYCGGEMVNGFVKGQSKTLGTFGLVYDTVAPVIKASQPKTKNISTLKVLNFHVSDNLSGIDKFRMEINGKWVLAEYEHKSNTIFYTIDKDTPSGELSIKLQVWDKKGNVRFYSSQYTR